MENKYEIRKCSSCKNDFEMFPFVDANTKTCCYCSLEKLKEKNNQKGWVYIFECEGFYKIGFSGDVNKRLDSMITGCPFDIKLVFSFRVKNSRYSELYWHIKFRKYNIKGEWFKIQRKHINKMIKEYYLNKKMINDTIEIAY